MAAQTVTVTVTVTVTAAGHFYGYVWPLMSNVSLYNQVRAQSAVGQPPLTTPHPSDRPDLSVIYYDMPLSLEIVPTTDILHMYGSQDTEYVKHIKRFSFGLRCLPKPATHLAHSASYSLSGQVVLSMTPPRSTFSFAARQPALLTSLTVTFEGKQEHFAPTSGYTARRLCQTSQTLVVPSNPIAVPSTSDHKMAIVFDLAVPGWLPATLSSKHSTTASTSYAIYATATYVSDEYPTVFTIGRQKSTHAHPVQISVKRNRTTSAPKPCTYSVAPGVKEPSTSCIPPNIASGILAKIHVPSYLNIADQNFDLRVELGSAAPGVSVHEFTVKLAQRSTYFTSPNSACTLPLPPANQQPPKVPLLSTHELMILAQHGISFPPDLARMEADNVTHPEHAHTFLMSEGEVGHSLESTPSTITVPIHLYRRVAHADYTSPFLDISHVLQVDFLVSYNGSPKETLCVKIGLPFVEQFSADTSNSAAPPAYCQLFHSNGEARYVAGLPAYSKICQPGEVVDTTGAHPLEFQRRAVERLQARPIATC